MEGKKKKIRRTIKQIINKKESGVVRKEKEKGAKKKRCEQIKRTIEQIINKKRKGGRRKRDANN